jgi:hypothetical protein
LFEEFGIRSLSGFSIVVEGRTDRDYLVRAAALMFQDRQIDLLEIPEMARDGGSAQIQVCTPGGRDCEARGGASRMVFLSKLLRPFWRLGLYRGIMFVFDHDPPGIEGCRDVRRAGFEAMTLDPKVFPSIRGNGHVFVEDLLSLKFQTEFFERGGASCERCYERGDLVRIRWREESKFRLCDYACDRGELIAFAQFVALLKQIRSTWGLPTPIGSDIA